VRAVPAAGYETTASRTSHIIRTRIIFTSTRRIAREEVTGLKRRLRASTQFSNIFSGEVL
jgi:hypothetical protein